MIDFAKLKNRVISQLNKLEGVRLINNINHYSHKI